jgi:hypothetical protein
MEIREDRYVVGMWFLPLDPKRYSGIGQDDEGVYIYSGGDFLASLYRDGDAGAGNAPFQVEARSRKYVDRSAFDSEDRKKWLATCFAPHVDEEAAIKIVADLVSTMKKVYGCEGQEVYFLPIHGGPEEFMTAVQKHQPPFMHLKVLAPGEPS